jgi:acyl-coenzyme A synthetase/AMP-(fatty) acid ligase
VSADCWRATLAALRRHGEHVALRGTGPTVSYRQLSDRAAAVADALVAAGARPGDRVGCLSAGRAHDESVALAGILGAEAVAVPLDSSSPPLRLAALLEQSGCRALVIDSEARRLLGPAAERLARIELGADGSLLARAGVSPAAGVDADRSLACVLHTSGSTGTPKPIAIGWLGLDVFTAWMIELTGLGPADRVLRLAELVFDLAWFDHLASWRTGATLCTLSRRELAVGRTLLERIRALAPSVLYAVPSLLTKLVGALGPGEPLDPTPRVICFAGEVYPPRQLAELAARAPGARLFNLFGPTETNVCTFYPVDRARLDGVSEIPIGWPCPYADCRLVDEQGATIAGAGAGELVVRGPTAVGGEVATRDRVERDARGTLWFRGRIDRMVKIRGYRVDPGEVEAALAAHPAVREAAVLPFADERLGTVLHGHVALLDPAAGEPRALRKHVAERLAAYMVPERIVLHAALPRTATGKIDYRAL